MHRTEPFGQLARCHPCWTRAFLLLFNIPFGRAGEFTTTKDRVFGVGKIETDLKSLLNGAQYEAVTTTEGPVLVIAGAGSGKTRVIEYRASYLVQSGADPQSILLLTFTRRSAEEMIQRAARRNASCAKIEGGTFHSFASRVLRRHSRALGLSGSFTIYDEGDAEEAIRRCCNRMGYDQDKEFPKKSELKSLFSVCVNKELTVDDAVKNVYGGYDGWLSEIKDVQKEYGEYKRRSQCLDYDDLLVYLRAALADDDERKKICEPYEYIMVDEFQDTNGVQADIVSFLAKKNGNIMAVGDDAQSIYGFRGADHRNILAFPTAFAGCRVIKLEQNYRSTQPILDVGNAVLANMKHRFDKRLVSATSLGGDRPGLRHFGDVYEEALWVAEKIRTLNARDVKMGDIAVLFRTSFASMPLQSELIKRSIRFKLFGGRKFFETAHVRDVVSYLKIVVNPSDELAWYRVLMLLPGVGIKTVERLLSLISHYGSMGDVIHKVLDTFSTGQKHSDLFASFRNLLQSLNAQNGNPGDQLDRVISYYGPIMKAKYRKDSSRAKELNMLRNMARRYTSLKDFLADIAVDPEKENSDESEFLTLSTVHSAKGLEWGRVFIVGLVDGIFPSSRSVDDASGADLDEEQRLLYVAVTRAKDELFLSHYDKGNISDASSSLCRFLVADNVRSTFDDKGNPVATLSKPSVRIRRW
jgi:DNA helicase II / ATP-dependent DNA helicase PcrA